MLNRLAQVLKHVFNPQRLINNIVWRWPRKLSNLSPVFVVGSPRSGTTLLQRILCSHNNLFSISGETGLFTWQDIFDPKRKHFGFSDEEIEVLFDNSSDVVDFFSRCVRRFPESDMGQRFVEKTPQHVLRLGFILKYFPNAQVIHIIRDGRDCYCSSKKNAYVPQNKSVKIFARYWTKCVSAGTRYKDDNRVKTVKYEELVAHPEAVVSQIMEFLGCNFEADQLSSAKLGNDPRADMTEFQRLGQGIDSSSVGRWRNELDESDQSIFNRAAGKMLAYWEY